MMKSFAGFAAAAALTLAPAAALAAGSWEGGYIGAQMGVNRTSANNGISSESALDFGALGGYNYQLSDHFTLGADLYTELNPVKTHDFAGSTSAKVGTDTYGVDVMAGFPVGANSDWMPFVKVGYGWANFNGTGSAGIPTANAARYGGGVAWRLNQAYDVNFQYMYQKFGSDTNDWKNRNFTVGFTYHFK